MSKVKHWLEDPQRTRKPEHEHINRPRIDAETILKLIQLKNSLLGTNKSVYEESRLAEELSVL